VEGHAAESISGMGRILILPTARVSRGLAALAALLILATAATRAAVEVPFAVTTRGLTFTQKVASVTVLPGADLDLEIAGKDGPYRLVAESGTVSVRRNSTWRWRAPSLPGLVELAVEDARGREVMDINAFVLVPFDEVRDGRLNGYRIGTYPEKTRPVGFVEVTPDTMLAKVSPHFALRQFLCKQPGGFPKYVVISEPLVLKLERIVEARDDAGHDDDTLTVMSGYRTPYYNESIGNVRDSQHTAGTAADVFVDETSNGRMDDLDRNGVVTRGDAMWLFRLIDGMDRTPAALFKGGLGDYDSTAAHGPFVHVDVRGRLARWRG
jgi:hypothetical protein